MAFEYLIVDLASLPIKPDIVDQLNDLGALGWELVAVTPMGVGYFKRAYSAAPKKAVRARAEAVTR